MNTNGTTATVGTPMPAAAMAQAGTQTNQGQSQDNTGRKEKILFPTNVPVTLALKYANGKRVDSQYNEYEVYYSSDDGRYFYAPPVLDSKITVLNLKAREEFTICKSEIRTGNGKPRIEWQVTRCDAPVQAAQERPEQQPTTQPQTRIIPPLKMPMDRALTLYLLTAGRCTRQAEQILGHEGGSVRFDSRDVAALATTMFIHAGREGWLTEITNEAGKYVAQEKIAELEKAAEVDAVKTEQRQPTPQPKPPASEAPTKFWRNRGECRELFGKLREAVGETVFFQQLAAFEVNSVQDFWRTAGSQNKAIQCYQRLLEIAKAEAAS